MRRNRVICFLLAAITLLVYWPVRHHGFVLFDDTLFVTENPYVQAGLTLQTVVWAFTSTVADNWHPITCLSHALDCQLFGVNASAHHLVNLVLHIANAVLLFLVLQRITKSPWRSAVVAGLFALHPFNVESVAWVAERKNVLSTSFMLGTLWAYVRYVEELRLQTENTTGAGAADHGTTGPRGNGTAGSQKHAKASFWYRVALVLFILGLMSKPMLVTLPFVLLLLDFWPLRRFEVKGDVSTAVGALIIEKWRFFLLVAIFCWVTMAAQSGGVVQLGRLKLGDRFGNALVSYYKYIEKMVWPTNLAVIYPHPGHHYPVSEQWPIWQACAVGTLLLSISLLCIYRARIQPYLAVGWFWFLGTLVPVIGLVQVGEQAMADRYMYVPLIGLFMSLVWLCSEQGWPRIISRMFGGLAILVLGAYALMARHQLAYWGDTIALFEHTTEVTGDNPGAHFALGNGFRTAGRDRRALVHYHVATAIEPRLMGPYYNTGQVLEKNADWEKAAEFYLKTEQVAPNFLMVQLHLANVLPHLDRYREAALHMGKALRGGNTAIAPQMLAALAWGLATNPDAVNRDGPGAAWFGQRACELTRYSDPGALGALAAAYAETGRYAEAVTTAEMASRAAGGDDQLTRRNQQLLQSCRERTPFREAPKPEPRVTRWQ